MNCKLYFLFFILILFISSAAYAINEGLDVVIGISPSVISNEILLGGQTYSSLTHLGTVSDVPLGIKLSFEEDNLLSKWIYVNQTEFTLLPNETIQLKWVINVPKNAEIGKYGTNVSIMVSKIEEPIKPTVKLNYLLQLNINIGVISKKIFSPKLNYAVFSPHQIEEKKKPVLDLSFTNNGNQKVSIKRIDIIVFENIQDNVLLNLTSERIADGLIMPFEKRNINVAFPSFGLEKGYYRAKITAITDYNTPLEYPDFIYFEIIPSSKLSSSSYSLYIFILTASILLLLAIILIILKKTKINAQ